MVIDSDGPIEHIRVTTRNRVVTESHSELGQIGGGLVILVHVSARHHGGLRTGREETEDGILVLPAGANRNRLRTRIRGMNAHHILCRSCLNHANGGNDGENPRCSAGVDLQRRVRPKSSSTGGHAGSAFAESRLVDVTVDLTAFEARITQRQFDCIPGQFLGAGSWNDALRSNAQPGDCVFMHGTGPILTALWIMYRSSPSIAMSTISATADSLYHSLSPKETACS